MESSDHFDRQNAEFTIKSEELRVLQETKEILETQLAERSFSKEKIFIYEATISSLEIRISELSGELYPENE